MRKMSKLHVIKEKILASILIAAVVLSTSLIPPASASSWWSTPRPSSYTIYDDTIGSSHTDGVSSIDMGVHIVDYTPAPTPDVDDILRFRVSASANSREAIYYDWWTWNYNWYTVTNPTGITGDDAGVNLTLPFPVLYYGVEYNYVWVCSNGFLSFDSQSTNPSPQGIPNTNMPNSLVAPFWRNLEVAEGSITYGLISETPPLFVISWNNVKSKSSHLAQTFQVVIRGRYQTDIYYHNWIFFQYQSITPDCPTIVGLENQVGNKGIWYIPSPYNGLSLKFAHPSAGYRLTQLKITLSKSDGDAMIDFLENYIGGYNVWLHNTTDIAGGIYFDAIVFAGGLALGECGIMFETLLITAETAATLDSSLSPPILQKQKADRGTPQAWVEAPTYEEGTSLNPFDSTLAATVIWEFTDHYINVNHFLTVTAEASYFDAFNGNGYTIATSATLRMYPPPPLSGPGGGCPFVSVWNGSSYALDNNVLPRAVISDGADVEDYYRLERTPVRDDGKYMMLLSEFASEHSYFDQVKLLAVDHQSDVNIAVTPSGEILTYMNPSGPVSATDDYGNDRLNEISFIDGDLLNPNTYFQGTPGDYLVLNFGQVYTNSAKLVFRDDQKKMDDPCILVQVKNGSCAWQTVETLVPRACWSMEAANLSPYVVQGQDLTVRLYWLQPHRLDYAGLDTTPQANYDILSGNLVSAFHSTQGNVKAQLSNNDNVYVELLPSQQIQLEFTLPDNSKEARTYILYSKGHYTTIP